LVLPRSHIQRFEGVWVKNFFRTDLAMNDGRTIRYYDSKEISRTAKDMRDPAYPAELGELRFDALLNEWVAIAPHRHSRAFYPPKNSCPLCPITVDNLSEIPDSTYEVVVFDNKSPSFAKPDTSDFQLVEGKVNEAAGKCEVICFTPNHEGSFGQLPVERIELVTKVWRDRVKELSKLPYVQQIAPFENRGEEVGVTLNHPHGQIYAYPFIPPKVEKELAAAEKYFQAHNKVLIDEIVVRELADKVRIVEENSDWVAYVPFAARYPFEIHITPKDRKPDLAELTDEQISSFAPLAKKVFEKLDGIYQIPMPYIAAWHQAPVRQGRKILGVHLQITSIRREPNKLKYLAGSESAMGSFIMDISPEEAADLLNQNK
jgi:UDPglucose--hexose-1-phosphate uridylyltransferase